MYLKQLTHKGITRLYFYESYYENGKVKQRSLEALGRLDELEKQYDNPVEHFKMIAGQRTEEAKEAKSASVSIDLSQTMDTDEDSLKNVGYGVLKELYKLLKLDVFWKRKLQKHNIEYDGELIFRLLVFSRAMSPASKKRTYEKRNCFFEAFEGFSLDNIYDFLDLISLYAEDMQKWIYNQSAEICERDMSIAYFDCTNYYFDISRPDMDTLDENGDVVDKNGNHTSPKYRKRGPEKNHRKDPIIEMGLLMDANGIPLAYDLFPGNESEKLHMRPIINRIKTQFSDTRTIFVADRGLNTSDNIYYLNGDNRGDTNSRDGYVYGRSVRGASEEFKAWILGEGYTEDKVKDHNGNDVTFRHKSRIYPKEIDVQVTVPGQKKKRKKRVTIDQKQMVYYSEKYARKQKADREVMIERAKDLIEHPKKYDKITAAGCGTYISNIAFDKTTGEVVEGRKLTLDEEKVKEQELYDGYYSIVTSELELDDLRIREIYRGLALIEDTFKVTKTDIHSRPVYVWTNEHIEGHFATCFTVLVLMRLLQNKLKTRYPVGKILESLKKYCCVNLDANTYRFVYYDEILKECSELFNLSMNEKYKTRLQIRRMLRY